MATKNTKSAKRSVPVAALTCKGGGIGHEILTALGGPKRCRKFSIHFEIGRAVYVRAEYFATEDSIGLLVPILGRYQLVERKHKKAKASSLPAPCSPLPAP